MKIILEHNCALLSALGHSLETDKKTWESWRGLYLPLHGGNTGEPVDAGMCQTAALIKHHLSAYNGCAFICSDNSLIVICQHVPEISLRALANIVYDLFEEYAPLERDYTLFALPDGQQEMAGLCRAKTADGATAAPQSRVQDEILIGTEDIHPAEFDSAVKHRQKRKRPCAMLVEDDPLTQRIVTRIMGEYCSFIVAENVREAVSQYMLHMPDVVFLDIGLPDGNGLHALENLLACDADAYVVMFSADNDLETMVQALNLGAQGYIAKPFRKEKMLHYIESCRRKPHRMPLTAAKPAENRPNAT